VVTQSIVTDSMEALSPFDASTHLSIFNCLILCPCIKLRDFNPA